MDNPFKIVLKPLITEKGTVQTEKCNVYSFMVHSKANKKEVARAVEKLFDVHVVSVNTMVRKGKRKGRGTRIFQRPDVKRALVELRPGEAIEFI